MKKILSIFPILLLLFILYPKVASAATVSINDVISTSKASGSPLGDCVGPDKKHFQTTRETCDALNKAWGKGNGAFSIGAPTPPSTPAVIVATAITASQTGNSPTGDCVGPDKKHFQTTGDVCTALNKAWGKNTAPFNVGVASPIAPPVTLSEAVSIAQANNSPTGDCIGPDKKHFDASKEVCETFNKSWGKTNVTFNLGVSASLASGSFAEVISKAQSSDVPKGDCIGPDKKHLQTTKEACDALNHAWGKTVAPFTGPSISAPTSGGTSNAAGR